MKNKKILLLAILTYIFVSCSDLDDNHGHEEQDHSSNSEHGNESHDHSSHSDHGHDDHNPGHDGDPEKLKSPNGGRMIKSISPMIEFVLQEDNSIKLSFLNTKGEFVSPEQQIITLVSGTRSKPIQMKFIKSGNSLLSDGQLPSQNNLPIVLNIKVSPDSKNVYEKFMLNLNVCGGCNLKEYACTCDHDEGHDHGKNGGHDHGEHGHKH